MFWDAIVLGAGPAGIAAAVTLHRAGKQVLLLDRKQFPRAKACAGMLSASAVAASPFPLMPVICGVSHALLLRRSGVETLHTERNILTHRITLDAYMHQQAVSQGVPFRQISSLAKLTDTGHSIRLITQAKELLQARTLIAADGANSTTRQLLGMMPVSHCAISLELDLPVAASTEKTPALFDYDVATGGYGWCFSKGSSSNFGIALMQGITTKAFERPDQCLNAFLKKLNVSKAQNVRVRGAAIGAFGQHTSAGSGNILLCGDAAGLADPVTGEGISFAFRSGREAALATLFAKHPNEALLLYTRQLQSILISLNHRKKTQADIFSYGISASDQVTQVHTNST